MNSRFIGIIAVVSLTMFALTGLNCAPTEPSGPPPELLSEMSGSKAIYDQVKGLEPSEEILKPYEQAMARTEEQMEAGIYSEAIESAKQATMLVHIAFAKARYEKLLAYDPPQTLTYHSRIKISEADKAFKDNDYDKTIQIADQAREQVELAIKAQQTVVGDTQQRMAKLKKDIETMYQPSLALIDGYWDIHDALAKKDHNQAAKLLSEIDKLRAQQQRIALTGDKYLMVNATAQEVLNIGNPRMYASITETGYLKPPHIATVKPGTNVIFIRSMLYSREKIFYYVQDPHTGNIGWMSEHYILRAGH